MTNKQSRYTRILKSPLGILAGIILGISLGLINPELGHALGPFAELFYDFMKMCVIPILITSISLSVSRFLKLQISGHLTRILSVFFAVLMMCSLIGLIVALVSTPGKDIDPSKSQTLQEVVENAASFARSLDEPIEQKIEAGVTKFLLASVPSNIFKSLADSDTFKILMFALIFGAALGLFVGEGNPLYVIMETIQHVYTELFEFIALLLPLAAIFFMAESASHIGVETLIGMTTFIVELHIAFFILFALSHLIIMVRTRTGPLESLNILKYPIVIAISTNSSIAAIPAAIKSMLDFKLPSDITNMLVPLGTVIGRYGNIIYFAFAAVFVIQLYQIELEPTSYIFIGLMSVFAGIASSGQAGHLTLPLLAIILDPLGIPISAVLVLFVAIDGFIEPMRTLINVHTNCAAVALMYTPNSRVTAPFIREKHESLA